jgi:hypothetical protein
MVAAVVRPVLPSDLALFLHHEGRGGKGLELTKGGL